MCLLIQTIAKITSANPFMLHPKMQGTYMLLVHSKQYGIAMRQTSKVNACFEPCRVYACFVPNNRLRIDAQCVFLVAAELCYP